MIAEYNTAEKMAKLMLYIFVALLAASLIMGAPDKCGRHGDPVSICILTCFIFLIKPFFCNSYVFFKYATINEENKERALSLMILPSS